MVKISSRTILRILGGHYSLLHPLSTGGWRVAYLSLEIHLMEFHMIFRVEALNREHLFMEGVNRNLSHVAGGIVGLLATQEG